MSADTTEPLPPPWRDVTTAVVWANPNTSEPVDDLRLVRFAGEHYGDGDFGRTAEARMSGHTFAALAANRVIGRWLILTADATLDEVNALLDGHNLPQVVIDDTCRDWVVTIMGRGPDGSPEFVRLRVG